MRGPFASALFIQRKPMTDYEIYVFILCFIVFAIFTLLNCNDHEDEP